MHANPKYNYVPTYIHIIIFISITKPKHFADTETEIARKSNLNTDVDTL